MLILLQYLISGIIIQLLYPSVSSVGFIYTDSNVLFILNIISFFVTNENANNAFLTFFSLTLSAFGKPASAHSSKAALKPSQ